MTELTKGILEGLATEGIKQVVFRKENCEGSNLELFNAIEELTERGVSCKVFPIGDSFEVEFSYSV